MCSLEVNDLIKVNRSISDDEDNQQQRLASGRNLEAWSSSDSLLPFLSSPKQIKSGRDKKIVNAGSINGIKKIGEESFELDVNDIRCHDERSPELSIASKHDFEASPVRGTQRTSSRNSDLIRKLSPAQGRVKDSIARHNFHLSNFLAANPGHDLSSSPPGEQSLDLTDLFDLDENHTPDKSPFNPAHHVEENTNVFVEAPNPEGNGRPHVSPEMPNEKNLVFGKIRVRTHDVTESGKNLDWGRTDNSESFVVDDYERRCFEKKKAQRKAAKQKGISTPDAISKKLEIDATRKSGDEQKGNRRVGSLAALPPHNETVDEDFGSLISGRSDKSSSSRVSFGDVRVRRHKQTLGDHPCVSQGPPVALDWSYMSSQHFDLEDYETISGERQKAQKISREEREELLRTKGVSDDSLSRIEFEVEEIKASRKAVKEDKKKEDDIMIYKLLSSTSLREARLTTRRHVAETEILHSKQKLRRNPTHLSDFQPTAVANGIEQSAKQKADTTSTEKRKPKLSSQRWRRSLRNLFRSKKNSGPSATNVLRATS